MKKLTGRKWMFCILLTLWVIAVRCLSGCSAEEENQKERDLEFTIVGEEAVPPDLLSVIQSKGEEPFKLTYFDEQNLYIAVGYGRQESGGFSISVNALYLTDNAVVIDTELKGPEPGEDAGTETSAPYIVVKTEYLENPVVFQ